MRDEREARLEMRRRDRVSCPASGPELRKHLGSAATGISVSKYSRRSPKKTPLALTPKCSSILLPKSALSCFLSA